MCRNTKARGRPTGKLSGEIFWLGGSRYVVQRSTAYNLSPRTNCYRMQITRRGWPSVTKPNFGSFQFACMVSLAVMLVFAGFLPPASPRAHDPSDETSAKVSDSPAEERLLRSKFSG